VRKWFGSQIGSSLDFTQRQIKGSVEEYHKLWLQKLDLAREDGFLVVPGIVPSVFEVDKTRYILDFCRRHDLRVVNIDRFNAYGAAYLGWPTNAQHSQFLINLFDDLMRDMETHGNAALIMVIAAAIRGVVQGVPGDRWGGTCQSDFIVIEPDGSLNNCPDKTSHDAAYGYAQDGYDAFAKNSLRRKSIKIQQILHKRDHCITCMYNTWCKSGCPITPNGPQDGQDECAGYKRFLDHVRMVYATESGKAVVDAYMRQKGPRLVNGVYGTFDDTAEGLAVQRSA
jgi:radical SAM protein with 4Fe4S-binding SPASM domain